LLILEFRGKVGDETVEFVAEIAEGMKGSLLGWVGNVDEPP
jgi:hypothetical protein